MTMNRSRRLGATAALACCTLGLNAACAQMSDKYQPNAESKKLPEGSAIERRVRMHQIAAAPAYTRKFDLTGLPN
jgi:hypothetical protein